MIDFLMPFTAKWDSIYTVVKKMEKADEEFTAQHPFFINDDGDIIINKVMVGKVFLIVVFIFVTCVAIVSF